MVVGATLALAAEPDARVQAEAALALASVRPKVALPAAKKDCGCKPTCPFGDCDKGNGCECAVDAVAFVPPCGCGCEKTGKCTCKTCSRRTGDPNAPPGITPCGCGCEETDKCICKTCSQRVIAKQVEGHRNQQPTIPPEPEWPDLPGKVWDRPAEWDAAAGRWKRHWCVANTQTSFAPTFMPVMGGGGGACRTAS